MDFARREPSLYAPTNDALAQTLRRFNDIIVPATECMARLRPEMAELYWNITDRDGNITNSDTITGPAAYETWQARHELPVDSRASLAVAATDESTESNVLIHAPVSFAAEDIHDPRAAQAFEASENHYEFIHYQLWRCAADLCGMVEADRLMRDFQ